MSIRGKLLATYIALTALGMALLPLRFALYFLVPTPLQLLGVQLLDGPTFAAFAIVGISLLAAQTPAEERAWALSVYAAAGTVGPVVGPLLAGLVAGQVGLQPLFGLVAGHLVPLSTTNNLFDDCR